MPIAITTISILAITGLVRLANRVLPLRLRSGRALAICPICAGVAGTWLWILAGMYFGLLPTANYQLPTAILMGGSVVGVAYQIEKRLPPGRSPLLWKTLCISAGFVAAYGIVTSQWTIFITITAMLLILTLGFLRGMRRPARQFNRKAAELEEKMKHCC